MTSGGGSTNPFRDGAALFGINGASIAGPSGIVITADGSMYVTDFGYNRIRKITFT
jgi:streptogramin lyase